MGQRVGILGASGYVGGELFRLIEGHPAFELVYVGGQSSAGSSVADVHPQLLGGERVIEPLNAVGEAGLDLAFLALPHGTSAGPAVELAAAGVKVVDLGADFRFGSPEAYEAAYGKPHPYPDQLGTWPYGIPELFRDEISASSTIAVPGCYPTSAVLALAPVLGAGLVDDQKIVVNAVSGATGAGRAPLPNLTYGAVAEGVAAYGLLTHRHRPEIERGLGLATGVTPTVLFTPHLVPMLRGILATCYAHAPTATQDDLTACLADAYADAGFVEVITRSPQTRWVVGSNRCLLSIRLDKRTRTAVVLSALDNLLKGAAGQAIQCANLMLGLDEGMGLPTAGWLP